MLKYQYKGRYKDTNGRQEIVFKALFLSKGKPLFYNVLPPNPCTDWSICKLLKAKTKLVGKLEILIEY